MNGEFINLETAKERQEDKNLKEKLLKIINYYGEKNQREYLGKEYQELQDEIYKCINGNECNILTEIADVLVLTLQFMAQASYSFDLLEENLKREINYKVDRQLGRIENESK